MYGILTAIEDIWQSGIGGKLIFDSLWSVMDTSLHQTWIFMGIKMKTDTTALQVIGMVTLMLTQWEKSFFYIFDSVKKNVIPVNRYKRIIGDVVMISV